LSEHVYHPDEFELPGDTITSRINKMFAETPIGARCFWPGGYGTLTPTPGEDYYVRLQADKQIISDSNIRNPILFADSGGLADVFLFEPAPPVYAAFGSDWHGLHFGVHTTWTPENPLYSYCRDVIRINMKAGHGAGKFSARKIFASGGTGWAINVIGLPGEASMFGSYWEKIRLEGKFGIDLHCSAGTGEFRIEDVQGHTVGGPALRVRQANKLTLRQWNIEQKGWQSYAGPKRILDIGCADMVAPYMLNGLHLDDITVLNQTGITMDALIYVNNAILARTGRISAYAGPGTVVGDLSPALRGLEFGSNCLYPRIVEPPMVYGVANPNKVVAPVGTRPYGVEVMPQYWNPPLTNPQTTLGILKAPNGRTHFTGRVQTTSTPPNSSVLFGSPNGFRPHKDGHFRIPTDVGSAVCRVTAQTDASNGHPVSVEQITPGSTMFYFDGVSFPEFYHTNGIETIN
jgi:hypothetical protein